MRRVWLLLSFFYALSIAHSSAQSLVINEIMASNRLTISDATGGFEDWAELFNPGDKPVDAAGFYVSDDPKNLRKWQIPNAHFSITTIPPKGFLLLWLDGDTHEGALHAPFKLDAAGEYLLLSDAQGQLLDSVAFDAQQPDIAWGRYPDGVGDWAFLANPTPQKANDPNTLFPLAPPPTVSMPSGAHRSGTQCSLAVHLPQATIHYTLDGSVPDETDLTYGAPFAIEKTTVLRARTFAVGYRPSEVVSHTFLVDESHEFAIFSIVFEPNDFFDPVRGIYTNTNLNDEERPVHVSFFEPDGTLGFATGMAAELQGSGSVSSPQKSLLLKAKGSQGLESIRYPVFPEQPGRRYRRLVLRNSGQDWNVTMFRDAYVASLGRDRSDLPMLDTLRLAFQEFRPVVVYLNGAYWGIYNLHDQVGDDFLRTHYGIGPDSVDFLDLYDQTIAGDTAAWFDFWRWTSARHFSSDAAFANMAQRHDTENFMDYAIFQIAADNIDWPLKNWRRFRPKTPNGRWQWVPFDFDLSFGLLGTDGQWNSGYAGQNAFERALDSTFRFPSSPDWATLYLRRCLENKTFRHRFLNRTADLLNTVFEPQRLMDRLVKFAALYRPEMEAQFVRWWLSGQGWDFYWDDNIKKMQRFAGQRATFCFAHAAQTFHKDTRGTVRVTLAADPPQAGGIEFSTLHFGNNQLPWTGTYFRDIPIPVKAVPNPGWRFKGWSHSPLQGEAEATFALDKTITLTALFEQGSPMSTDTQEVDAINVLLTPNPAKGQVAVRTLGELLSVQLINNLGQIIRSWNGGFSPPGPYLLPIEDIPPGVYTVSIELARHGTIYRRLQIR